MPKGSITPVSEIKKHLEQFKLSNQKISDYCRSHNIASSTFHGWNKRFNISKTPSTKLTKKDFITVPILPSEKRVISNTGTIKFSNTTVELRGEVSTSLVQGILETLKSQRIVF